MSEDRERCERQPSVNGPSVNGGYPLGPSPLCRPRVRGRHVRTIINIANRSKPQLKIRSPDAFRGTEDGPSACEHSRQPPRSRTVPVAHYAILYLRTGRTGAAIMLEMAPRTGALWAGW
jgi:hypothetical protein